MSKPGNRGFTRIVKATGYSVQGFRAALRHEAAFRQELALVLTAVVLATLVAKTPLQWLLLVGSGLLVLIVELLNSAIEAVVDRHGEEWHELSGRAKDMGSAAVMFSLIMMALTWGIIVWEAHLSVWLS
ncbi:MAG: diacylglycerol kinase [Natronospirillum sp.]|uniref:diacylglycerol kinase n=1 Tax=Natronospirillum sp. TaxID=2812955 RepID=UPI0025FCF759|nr:diacylglycerol kinase [Natronospirillum sp.]MCH8552137.1 diacylglycerol kinase [Natronospirillum sp.]